MINLMPNEYKEALHYARRNTVLLNWLLGLGVILAITTSTVIVGKTYLHSESKRYDVLNTKTAQELKDQNLEGTLATIDGISSNLKLIIQVLSRQVIFSKLIQQIGSVMPTNSVLSNIEINKITGGLDLTVKATDYTTATQAQVNLADPNNKLFDKVDIVSIKCDDTSNPSYPCTVSLRALFTANNPFLFINQSSEKVKS